MEQDRKPEINLHIYDQLIYDNGGKITILERSLQQRHWENWTATCKKMKLDLSLTHLQK